MYKHILSIVALMLAFTACSASSGEKATGDADSTKQDSAMQTKVLPDKYVELNTTKGNIVVRLYGDTPKHQENFLKLVKEGFYNNVLFHRVINEFMIQTGDPDSKDAKPGQMLGSGGPGYDLDAEIVYPRHFHKRGALAAARQGDQVNPQRRSSGSQFYIVTGRKISDAEMQQVEQQYAFGEKQAEFNRLAQENMAKIRAMQAAGDQQGLNTLQQQLIDQVEAKFAGKEPRKLPAEIAKAYKEQGGTPHLDDQYTVFGEVVSGWETIDAIEKAQTDTHDRPTEDIRIISAKEVSKP